MGELAEAFPAGQFLRDELTARGWTQVRLAEILGRPPQAISEIISGKKAITYRTAVEIGAALGTSSAYWLHLQTTYELWRLGKNREFQARIADIRKRACRCPQCHKSIEFGEQACRRCWRRCIRKHRFHTPRHALAAWRRMQAEEPDPSLSTYPCRVLGLHWHVGHEGERSVRRRAQKAERQRRKQVVARLRADGLLSPRRSEVDDG